VINQIEHVRRVWILLILRATRLCGFATISAKTFHRLALFSNSLAPTNHVEAETAKVLKTDYGPYFPDYQVELDRLVGLQLIDVVDLKWQSEDGRFISKYRISNAGMSFLDLAIQKLNLIAQSERAVSETISAFAEYQIDKEKETATVDANYGIDTLQIGELVDYGEWIDAHNYATEAAEYMAGAWQNRQSLKLSPEDSEYEVVTYERSQVFQLELEPDDLYELPSSHLNRAAVYLYAQYIQSKLSGLIRSYIQSAPQ